METDAPRDELEIKQRELTNRFIEKQLKGDRVKEYIIPLGSLLVAFLGVLSGVFAQYLGSQAALRAGTITAKQSGYSKILTNLDAALEKKRRPGGSCDVA